MFSLISDIGKVIEEQIFPFLDNIDTKEKAINEILYGNYGLDYDTANLLVKMGYGKEIFLKLLERPVYYEKLLRTLERNVSIPIFEDKQIYIVYLVLKKEKHNKNEINVFAKIRGISQKNADKKLQTGDRLLAEGDAMLIKEITIRLKGYSVNYTIEPEFKY